jgi:hypothetical protein
MDFVMADKLVRLKAAKWAESMVGTKDPLSDILLEHLKVVNLVEWTVELRVARWVDN